MIDYGDVEAPADAKISSHQAVLLGRYLSIVTDYGNEIDGLKYTAVSDMFYEASVSLEYITDIFCGLRKSI